MSFTKSSLARAMRVWSEDVYGMRHRMVCVSKFRVAHLDRDAGREFVLIPQLEGEAFGHADEQGFEEADVDRILVEGLFGGDGLALRIRFHGRVVDAVGFPERDAVFSEHAFEQSRRHFLQGCTSRTPMLRSSWKVFPYHRDLVDRGVERNVFGTEIDLELPVRFRLVGGDLGRPSC